VLKGIVSSHIKVTALFKENEDGSVGAVCPEIPGCVVIGSSRRNAERKIKAAVEACLKDLLDNAREKIRRHNRRTAGS